jgi:hypothetical protein
MKGFESTDRILQTAGREGRPFLYEYEVYEILRSLGLDVPAFLHLPSLEDLDPDLLRQIPSEKVVVKLVSPDVTHKTEIGGVRFVPNTTEDVVRAYRAIRDAVAASETKARFRGVMVAEMVDFESSFGHEVILSLRQDPAFGPVVTFGPGGIYTEFFNRAFATGQSFAVRSSVRLDEGELDGMIRQPAVSEPLFGLVRGQPAFTDEDSVRRFIDAMARLSARYAEESTASPWVLRELEINPVTIDRRGRLVAVDGLARIEERRPRPAARPVAKIGRLLKPESAAILGVSTSGANPGRIVLGNLLEMGGVDPKRIYVIHPKARQVDGVKCVPSVDDLPEPVDMAVIAIPPSTRPGGHGYRRQAQGAVDHPHPGRLRGDREREGPRGGGPGRHSPRAPRPRRRRHRQRRQLPRHLQQARQLQHVLHSRVQAALPEGPWRERGVDQPERRLPRGAGQQLRATALPAVRGLLRQPDRSHGGRLPALPEGRRERGGLRRLRGGLPEPRRATVVEEAQEIVEQGKVVLLYKAGRTREGSKAAASHTASMVGDYEVCRQLCGRAGVIVTDTLNMFEDYLMTFSFLGGKRRQGNRVAIISNAGFECTAAADKLHGLKLARFSPEDPRPGARGAPAGHHRRPQPDRRHTHHADGAVPGDRGGRGGGSGRRLPRRLGRAGHAGARDAGEIDRARGVGRERDEPPEASRPNARERRQAVVLCVDSGDLYTPAVKILLEAGLPTFRKIDRATRALSAFVHYGA